MDLNIEFNDLTDFYTQLEVPEKINSLDRSDAKELNSDNINFRGLPNSKILESKYSYSEGLELLKSVDLGIPNGTSKREYKWSEDDGDDMSYERLNDALPCMAQRAKTLGRGNGKFVTLNVGVVEHCGISYKDMVQKAHTVIQIADYLEDIGYKVNIVIVFKIQNVGSFRGETVKILTLKINLKKPEDPLNKAQLMACISPWFFRYFIFKFLYTKFATGWGLGSPVYEEVEDTREDIYIYSGQCLDEKAKLNKLEEIKKLFASEEEED
jgi:hypothetical protein